MIIEGRAEKARILLAHGAGAPMDSLFMTQLAAGLATDGVEVIRFEFPYMQKRRIDGKKRPPDRQGVLLEYFTRLIEQFSHDGLPLWLAGKSMGGRMATMLADHPAVTGCFVYGYPFYPPGKQDRPRVEHLFSVSRPVHIFQGCRDSLGRKEVVDEYRLSGSVVLHWLEDGDHDLKPRKISGITQDEHIADAVESTLKIINRHH
ncbi:alpha/beta fold hydrolase [Amphritea pacifica]|uniref:Alpha/beta fold hydrolase n=1 Tax=Amphritea pacifica TaxID=2811233 RepID=A0ABS2W3S7_9GAMM|nr:alpha/beta fold hydrolase [Amphritea pacifica]MBN0986157.1 alpha/beta fold hydrolase [Amphritea pacifica]MBN1007563.1 alpha/beta fold hydrolase [Amphritea pacifica]